jgi:SAM-dependent methyltransferase
MHEEAYNFSASAVNMMKTLSCKFNGYDVLDVGGRNVNGTIKNLFTLSDTFTSLDIFPDEGVDIVADFSDPEIVNVLGMANKYDVTFSTEVLEHARYWRTMVSNMVRATKPGGWIIITCATHGRYPHSAIDGHPLTEVDDEYYGNVGIDEFNVVVDELRVTPIVITTREYPADLYALIRK